ncbi:carbohydrate sulfotransferase 14-like isoform X2 [Anneissia japonica]|uniref:carbohydrate sulfotransferase 14-like isoform X2 n=1 Tax=Anneissia japonica TaxID=1529436 RepID=UPI0014257FDD|nr:carbohydrate sulfotransferase 14-like isoform X2 [Anneissia japonica]
MAASVFHVFRTRSPKSMLIAMFCVTFAFFFVVATFQGYTVNTLQAVQLQLRQNRLERLNAELTRSMRNKTLHTMCAGDPARGDVWKLAEPDTVFHQIIVDEQRKFLYCYVPKVACSNWKRVIKYIQGSLTDINTEVKMDHKKDLVFLDSFSQEEIDIKLKTYFKFMFVRNPIARLVSAYRNKFRENIVSFHKRYGVPIVRKYRKNVNNDVKGDDVTFEEFIRYLLDTDTSNMDMHWRPMNELCQPCAVNYDFIGSFEYLSVDANEVLKTIGAESDTFFPQRQRWYKPTTQQKISDEMSSVSLYYLQQLVEKYLVDFIMFGYPPPSLKPIVAGEEE